MKTNIKNKFLQGNYAPWTKEGNFDNLVIISGEIPKELNGVLYRNGPNPQFIDDHRHWFEGDGMLHAFFINNGQISYRNRWIETERFKLEQQAGKALFRSFSYMSDISVKEISHNTANTNIIFYAGKLLALQEGAYPTEINPINLSTIGKWDYQGQVPQMSAHPHFDLTTKEMHGYAYTPGSKEIVYYVFSPDGKVIKSEKLDTPFSSFMHDFFITKDYVLFPVLPLTFSMERIQQGKPMLMWEPDRGAYIGIMRRTGNAKDIIWLKTDPFYAFHYMNAYQDDNQIILDGMKSERAHLFPDIKGKIPAIAECPPRLTRFTLDIKQRKVTQNQIDSIAAEFPRFDERFTGLPYRHGFVAASINPKSKDSEFDSIIHYDHKNKSQTNREFGVGNMPNEPIFVPKNKDSEEGEGFILSIVYEAQRDTSDLYILDAMNIDKEPLAVIQLPHRIPNGFHGNWYEI